MTDLRECWVFDVTPGNEQIAITAPNGTEAYAMLIDGAWQLVDEGEICASRETQAAFADVDWQRAVEKVWAAA